MTTLEALPRGWHRGISNREQMATLCDSFPSLRGAPGTSPWDQHRFARWVAGPAPSSAMRQAGLFVPWRGTRASLKGNDPEGSYLANLINRGFVIALKRAHRVTGRGKGRSVDLYMIPLTIKRGDESTWPPKSSTA